MGNPQKSVCVLYSKIPEQIEKSKLEFMISRMSGVIKLRTEYYKFSSDKLLFIYGRLLLMKGLNRFGYSQNSIDLIKYNKYGRPYIDEYIDFNISHSGEYVVCAIGKDVKLGVDIEWIRTIDFEDYRSVMNTEQWECIHNSTDPINTFFKFWTIKESVAKGDSRGLTISLYEIGINENVAVYDETKWYLSNLNLNEQYCTNLACSERHKVLIEDVCIELLLA